MRIGMIIPSFAPVVGGAEKQLEGLLPSLGKLGISALVFTRMVENQDQVQKEESYSIYRLNSYVPKVGFGISLFIKLIKFRSNYDILHCHSLSGQASIVSLLAGRLIKKPVILKVTRSGKNSQLNELQQSYFGKIILWIIKNTATKFIAITEDVKSELEQVGVCHSKIIEIPNGVDLIEPKIYEEKYQLNIVTVGRLINRKRIDMLVEAFSEILPSIRASLIIAGSGPNKKTLMSLVEKKNIKESITFTDQIYKSEITKILIEADIFVLPSDSEGMSNALLEAMSASLPVLVANIPANQSLISNAENGILFDDYLSMRDSLLNLCQNEELRKKLGKNAKDLILKKYSFNKIAIDYKKLYSDLTDEI